MSSALANNDARPHLPDRHVSLTPRPCCAHCHHPMAIIKTAKLHLVGKEGNYTVFVEYYRCQHDNCPGCKDHWTHCPNPFAGRMMLYDYEVQAEVCLFRWQEHATYDEIVDRMFQRFGIAMDATAVELFLKSYEIGCSKQYREEFLAEIHDNGGIMLAIDVMEPLQGKDGFLVAYDSWSTLTLGSFRMPNNKQSTYEGFFQRLKDRIAAEIGEPILGIISDALPMQREAIENIFPGVPHCLCHYHFFSLVLKAAKNLDSNVVTQIREELRKMYDLKQFSFKVQINAVEASQYAKLARFLEPLVELSNWRRKPKDPCFIGIELVDRITDILIRLNTLQTKVQEGKIPFSKRDTKVLHRITEKVQTILNQELSAVEELKRIRNHLTSIVKVMDEPNVTAFEGLKNMQQICETLRPSLISLPPSGVEAQFITALLKFVDTKGTLLFNYRKIQGGPTTNNDLELRFKQLKHFLRRTIGQAAAKEYLMMHGERIFYVNPKESEDQILEILRAMDQTEARKQIRLDRRSADRIGLVMHDDIRWQVLIKSLDQYLTEMESC